MSAQELKALLHRYIEEVWRKQHLEAVDDFLAPNYRRHLGANAESLSREGQKQLLASFSAAFPDVELTVEEVLAERDLIAFRSTLRGTHRGTFRGIPATGRRVIPNLV